MSTNGKRARGTQGHKHVTGSTSFANVRADLVEEIGKEPSQLRLFEKAYKGKDGKFAKDTITEELLEEANAMVEEKIARSPSKSPTMIQDEVFNDLMYGTEIPKRPLTYGFGVNQGDVFGVTGMLRKEGYKYNNKRPMDPINNLNEAVKKLKEENEALVKKNQELESKLDQNSELLRTLSTQFAQAFDAMRNGKANTEILDAAAQFASRVANSQAIPDTSSGSQPATRSRHGDFPSHSAPPDPLIHQWFVFISEIGENS